MPKQTTRPEKEEELKRIEEIETAVLQGDEVYCDKCGGKITWQRPYIRCEKGCTLIHLHLGRSGQDASPRGSGGTSHR